MLRQTRRARHERHHEHRERAVLRVVDVAGGHDGGHVAAETDEHGDERAPVQANSVHDAVHQVGLTRHVARLLHQRDEEEQDDDVG